MEGGNFTIRRAELEDYAAIRDLNELNFRVHQRGRPDYFLADWPGYSREQLQRLLAHPAPIAWVAEVEERVVALCLGTIGEVAGTSVSRPRRVASVEDLVTLPAYRGRGIATALLKRARRQAAEAGAESLELCVWGFNRDARRLYERLGMDVQYTRMEWSCSPNMDTESTK